MREHPQYTKPELVATAPNQTWSWDITKLLGPTKWTYFYLYVVLDIFSRYAVGWMVADRENSALAGRLIEETCHKQGVQPQVLTLHSDRGAPMTSKCTAQLLADLGVTRSLSRPQVSDDNPFSEAQFKTLKYHPGFPGRFHDITAAIAFCRTFFPWYNTEHRHGGIAMLTPDDVHHNRTQSVLEQRGRTLQAAWTRHPERFVRGIPQPRRLDQPTCDTHNRRNCSVNRNRHCLKVVDRFRLGVDRIGLADLLDDPVAEHGKFGRKRHRLGLVMGDIDDRNAELLMEPPKLNPHGLSELEVRFDSGSSIRKTFGRRIMARPSATLCRSPPESWAGRFLRISSMPRSPDVSRKRSAISARGTRRFRRLNVIFFSAVMCG